MPRLRETIHLAVVWVAVAGSVLSFGCRGPSSGNTSSDETASDAGADARRDGAADSIDPVGDRGPGRVLDVSAARDRSTLGIEISGPNSGPVSVTVNQSKRDVFVLDFEFSSQTLWGREWRHPASLYLPEKRHPDAPPGAFVVLQGGTQNPKPNVSGGGAYRNNFAGAAAALWGLPALLVRNLPGPVELSEAPSNWRGQGPDRCFAAGLDRRRYTPCLLEVLRRTDAARADPFRHLGFAWMRAVTAAAEAARLSSERDWSGEQPPERELERALVLADGARAVGARMAAVVDVRIDGVFGNADFVQLPSFSKVVDRQWTGEETSWLIRPGSFRTWLGSSAGTAWRETVDPAVWGELVNRAAFANARGTGDPRFPIAAANWMRKAMPSTAQSVTASAYGAGIGTGAHLQGWWAFIAQTYLGSSAAEVSVNAGASGGNVRVESRLEGNATGKEGSVVWTQRHKKTDDRDFRDAAWRRTSLQRDGRNWVGSVAPIIDHHALYVEIDTPLEVSSVLGDAEPVELRPAWSSRIVFSDN